VIHPLWTCECSCRRRLHLWTYAETRTAEVATASAEARGWARQVFSRGEHATMYCSVLCRTIAEGEWIARAPRRRKVWRETYPNSAHIAPSLLAEHFIDWRGV